MDEVSRLVDPGFGTDVFGEEVEIKRLGPEFEDEATYSGLAAEACLVSLGCIVLAGVVDVFALSSKGLTCVWILVLTTSSGHVMTPAIPPAVVAVIISNARPMSLDPTNCFAHFCSCS